MTITRHFFQFCVSDFVTPISCAGKMLPPGQHRPHRATDVETIFALSPAFALRCPCFPSALPVTAPSSRSRKMQRRRCGHPRFPRKTPGTFSDQRGCGACATAPPKKSGAQNRPPFAIFRARSGRILRSASGGTTMRNSLWAAVSVLAIALAPTGGAQADTVGAAAGAGTGLVVAGPVGAVVGGVVGAVWGRPFWGPPHSPHACWIDNHFYRHCRWSHGHWYR
jgi:osmotically inducible lipoprotein OsmB